MLARGHSDYQLSSKGFPKVFITSILARFGARQYNYSTFNGSIKIMFMRVNVGVKSATHALPCLHHRSTYYSGRETQRADMSPTDSKDRLLRGITFVRPASRSNVAKHDEHIFPPLKIVRTSAYAGHAEDFKELTASYGSQTCSRCHS